MKNLSGKNAFTLMEIIVVVIIVSVLASLAIVGYEKTVRFQRCQKARNDLVAIYAAERIYRLKNRQPGRGDVPINPAITDIGQINAATGLELTVPHGFEYSLYSSVDTIQAEAAYFGTSTSTEYIIRIDEGAPIPRCTQGTCLCL